MKKVILTITVFTLLISTSAQAEKIQLGEGKFLNISLLIQPQFIAAQRAAPNGGVGPTCSCGAAG